MVNTSSKHHHNVNEMGTQCPHYIKIFYMKLYTVTIQLTLTQIKSIQFTATSIADAYWIGQGYGEVVDIEQSLRSV